MNESSVHVNNESAISSIQKRVKEERERLGLTQDSMAKIGGVSQRTQANYETGSRAPTAEYLAKVRGVGADVVYIVSGERLDKPSLVLLTPEERSLVDSFRGLPDDMKSMLVCYLDAMVAKSVKDGSNTMILKRKQGDGN